MKYFLLAIILLVSITCGAAIYMQHDANGNVSYSDMPSPNALRVDLPPPTTTQFSTPQAPPVNSNAVTNKASVEKGKKGGADAGNADADTHQPYTVFFISSPTDQQTFQNQRDLPVEISITPALQKGDSIQLSVDGAKLGGPRETTHFQLNQMPRGSHQVTATLLDENQGEIRQASPISFFVHYAAVGGNAQ
jgi:hypothetical protein